MLPSLARVIVVAFCSQVCCCQPFWWCVSRCCCCCYCCCYCCCWYLLLASLWLSKWRTGHAKVNTKCVNTKAYIKDIYVCDMVSPVPHSPSLLVLTIARSCWPVFSVGIVIIIATLNICCLLKCFVCQARAGQVASWASKSIGWLWLPLHLAISRHTLRL